MSNWQQIQLGGNTICSVGTPYAFFTRRGTSDKLLIYFQPGGAKPEGVGYDEDDLAFDPTVYIPHEEGTARDPHFDNDNPANWHGIFDLTDPRNPFTEYNIVFISYCSGDIHWGNNVHNGFHHNGYINAKSVLDWTYQQYPNPSRVFVTGSSAGASGASYHLADIATHYADVPIAFLSDSLGGVRGDLAQSLKNWGADEVLLNTLGYSHLSVDDLRITTPYIVSGQRFPHIPIAQFNTLRDFAQTKVIALFGTDKPLAETLRLNHAEIRAEIDNFYTYTVDDDYHVVLRKPKFYEACVNGVYLHEWVSALANGQPVESEESAL